MDTIKWPELEEDFRSWSGGFSPESQHEITVYVEYANPFQGRDVEVMDYLIDWLEHPSDEF